jgi:Dyp-type peroxidase family
MGLLEHPDLPTDDIQGDIVPGFRGKEDLYYAQHFLLLRVVDRDRAREELKGLLPDLTTAAAAVSAPGEPAMATSTNVGFTFAGLRELAPEVDLDGVFHAHEAFRSGLAERSHSKIRIDDEEAPFDLLGPSTEWTVGKDAHVVLNLGGRDGKLLAGHVEAVKQRVAGGFGKPCEQPGAVLSGRQREAFGFADGLSQPRVRGFHMPRAGSVVPPLPADRFLVADGHPVTTNGSFMVWVRFLQNRAEFEAHCDKVARKLDLSGYDQADAPGVAAMEVGRRTDGTSLTRSPITAARHVTDSGDAFDYADDHLGRRCPRHAHVRKMNPRTADAGDHAILRRGIPFRTNGEEGLIFVCYQASIEQQFERLQAYWANATYEPEANASPDPLISQRARDGCIVEIPLPRRGSVPVKVTNTWILPTGGFYAFMPSLTGLTHLLGSAL